MILGTAVMYLFGTLWLGYLVKRSFVEALWIGVIPYIPADLLKIAITLSLGGLVRRRLVKAGLTD